MVEAKINRTWNLAGGQTIEFRADLVGISENATNAVFFEMWQSGSAPIGWALDPGTNLDVPASYTDHGQSTVDLAAPGGDGLPDLLLFLVTLKGITAPAFVFDMVFRAGTQLGPDGPYEPTWTWAAGTSMAAPCVAGVAALVIGANGGSLPPDQVRTILEQSADDLGKPGNDDFYGAGRVNALRAVLQK